jgi:hypothetical protein
LLAGIGKEDGGAVLRPPIRPLAIELRRIVRHGEEDAQDLAVGDLRLIESDLHRLRVPGRAGGDRLVGGGIRAAARIAREHAAHALHVLKDSVHAPEAAAGQHGGLQFAAGGWSRAGAGTSTAGSPARSQVAPMIAAASTAAPAAASHRPDSLGDDRSLDAMPSIWARPSDIQNQLSVIAAILSRCGIARGFKRISTSRPLTFGLHVPTSFSSAASCSAGRLLTS